MGPWEVLLTRSGPLVSAVDVPLLLVGEDVDLHANRLELQPGDLLVDLLRHRLDALLEPPVVAQRLVGEGHVHQAQGRSSAAVRFTSRPSSSTTTR